MSNVSWPYKVRGELGAKAEPFNFLPCAGATIDDLREHQLPHLAGTNPAYVTVSIGGASQR